MKKEISHSEKIKLYYKLFGKTCVGCSIFLLVGSVITLIEDHKKRKEINEILHLEKPKKKFRFSKKD